MKFKKIEKLRNLFFKQCGFHYNSVDGASWGIVTFLNPKILNGVTLYVDSNHVATQFHHLKDDKSWILSNIYAPNNKNGMKKLWSNLSNFKTNHRNVSWLVMDDFNTSLREDEKKEDLKFHLKIEMILWISLMLMPC